MKKLLIITFIILSSTLVSFGQTIIGAGVTYGSYLEQPGIEVNGIYGLGGSIRLAPDFIYYFTDKVEILGSEFKTRAWEFNANIQYYILEKGIDLYAITGMNYTHTIVNTDLGERFTDGEFGLNLGAGTNFAKMFFAEFKYIISNADGFVVGVGVRFGK
jgi:hypothetical protein